MTKSLTRQTTQVCVLDQQGKPLMPTTRLGKVYRLLKTKKAHIVSYEPFTIQLDYEPDTHIIQPMTLGVDSDAIHSGYSVANEHREYYSAEVIARDDISKRLSDRRMYRQNRRSRKTRYRKPRFKNRKNKKKGWLQSWTKSTSMLTFSTLIKSKNLTAVFTTATACVLTTASPPLAPRTVLQLLTNVSTTKTPSNSLFLSSLNVKRGRSKT